MSQVIVFPGQGSQSIGMLNELNEKHPIISELFTEASDILGIDLWNITQKSPDKLNQTIYTQPIMLTAGYAVFKILKLNISNVVCMAGHSLGEWTALVSAGYLSFKDCLLLVKKRAELMESALSSDKTGAMAAIVGLSDAQVIQICHEIDDVVEPVNFNAPGQIVISGYQVAVEKACKLAKSLKAKLAVMLPVSVPSHCILMKPIAQEFSESVFNTNIVMQSIPILHNINATPSTNVHELKQQLIHQLYQPVQWVKTINNAINNYQATIILECGPNKVLTGLCKRIRSDISIFSSYNQQLINHYEEFIKE